MAEIDRLRKQRGYVKGKLTRIEHALLQGQAAATLDKEDAEVRLERLDQVIHAFHGIQQQIIDEGEEVSAADISAETEFEERSLSVRARLKRIISAARDTSIEANPPENDMLVQLLQRQMALMERREDSVPPRTHALETSNISPESELDGPLASLLRTQTEILQRLSDGNTDNSAGKVKLPTLKLPTFDGKIEEWAHFSDAFMKTIHDNQALPNIQKFIYLRSSVAGTAARAIEDIELSDDNYAVAWEQLRKRFEDLGVIKRRHIQCLLDMPSVDKESASAILRLVDHINKHTRVLKRLGAPTDSWGDLLLYLVEGKLDRVTLRMWEDKVSLRDLSTINDRDTREASFDDLMNFLIQRCHTLERSESSKSTGNPDKNIVKNQKTSHTKSKTTDKITTLASSVTLSACFLCGESHLLYNCTKFLTMAASERLKEVRRLKLCTNCLRNDHFAKNCKHGSCRKCAGRHNTLLHQEAAEKQPATEDANATSIVYSDTKTACHSSGTFGGSVLMATAIVEVSNPEGFSLPVRVLLDSGSEANFVTNSVCNKLGLRRTATSEVVSGVNGVECQVRQVANIVIKSKYSKFQFNASCLILPRITKDLPSREIDKGNLNIPPNLRLADIEFNKCNSVDLLIGAEFFFDLLESGKIDLGENRPSLQNTKLGWIVAGPVPGNEGINANISRRVNNFHCSLSGGEDLNKTLKQFWELENFTEAPRDAWSIDEVTCEEIYKSTTTRDEQGRFIVSLPTKAEIANIGETRSTALKRLMQTERRFKNNNLYRERYIQFMREYLYLGHMSLVESCNVDASKRVIYLPHHGVNKETSSTTKLRVVFDASNKSSTGVSLNDMLMVGPTLQDNLIQILLRFRFYNIALIGDLEKMYRQVRVRECDRDLQRILWRFSTSEAVQEYRLNTVTYGQASASYLAIRSVRQLAEEGKEMFPLASECILNDMYVDDIISGARNVKEAKVLHEQITELMSKGRFKVHKWHCNVPEILHGRKEEEESTRVDIKLNDAIRTLGLIWEPNSDDFVFTANLQREVHSKRELLSEIGKLFDPLGLVGPIITSAKILMQETWKEKIDWDSELPASILNPWEKLRGELSEPITFRVPRNVLGKIPHNELILYGFCDASQNAYGACVYVGTQDAGGQPARLLCSKSRVAPIKTVSIPRLELCGAVLLSRLLDQVKQACKLHSRKVLAFTDSLIVLYWIRGNPSRWKPFVANRVSEITNLIPADAWAHVKGEDNPADLLSRGVLPSILADCHMWWQGPPWLSIESTEIQTPTHLDETCFLQIEEIRREAKPSVLSCTNVRIPESIFQNLYSRISELNKLERVLAYALRFVVNCKAKLDKGRTEHLSVAEIETARFHLLKNAQAEAFHEEILALRQDKDVKASSKLSSLHPFVDDDGLLRVGGRIRHAPLPFAQRHPILLPSKHILTQLIIEREHKRLLHSGPQALLAAIRRKYWPLRGRDIVRKVYHSCVWCFRKNPRPAFQVMGDLPADRVTPMPPFFNCGVDFAGPIVTLLHKGRGRKTNKSYIALFVCLSTKAIHLEAVSDLTTDAFLATLKRFIGRRGRPQKIYSDNATNFKGAQREISELYRFVRHQVDGPILNSLTTEGIQWIFIPPYSPHFGGLWEAGVKSCKTLLRSVMGNSLFTFEELCTALIQVESCLNSRPLYALSNDPSDLEPLTPGHFLLGGPITALPETDLTDLNVHRLDRWQLVQRTFQDFWKRWAAEYVSSLQGRSKWGKSQQDLQIGDLVLLRDENAPPYQWKIGRITELHRGQDNHVRVVSVKITNGVTKRAITKLCKLPIRNDIKD